MTDAAPDKKERTHGIAVYVVGGLALIVIYVGAYFCLGEYEALTLYDGSGPIVLHERRFQSHIVRKAVKPLGWLESRIRNEPVTLFSGKNGTYQFDDFQ